MQFDKLFLESVLPDFLQNFSAHAQKRHLYGADISFTSACELLARANSNIPAWKMLDGYTAIVFKPDAIVNRSIGPTLRFLKDHGFDPLEAMRFRYNRNMISEAWRYQINIATAARLSAVEALLSYCDSFFVLLSNPTHRYRSASEHLTSLKGSAEVETRPGGSLRAILGNHSTFLNKIHTPDETADFIREMMIYFGPGTTRGILLRCAAGAFDANTDDLVDEAYAIATGQSLDIAPAIKTFKAWLKDANLPSGLKRDLSVAMKQERLEFGLVEELAAMDAGPAEWSKIVILTQYVQANLVGAIKLL